MALQGAQGFRQSGWCWMLRAKTTFVIGDHARVELEMPDDLDLLGRIANGLDFSRLEAEVQLRDAAALAEHLSQVAGKLKVEDGDVQQAAERTRLASKLSRSIGAILDQHGTDLLVELCGKVGVVYFTCQADANSTLQRFLRHSDDLPLHGTDTWLFRLAQLMVGGVPSTRIDKCFENVSIINFNPDRSIEHFLPHALKMAFGMPLDEAQAIVANELDIQHPLWNHWPSSLAIWKRAGATRRLRHAAAVLARSARWLGFAEGIACGGCRSRAPGVPGLRFSSPGHGSFGRRIAFA
jgi:hypothetical protein